MSLRQKAVCVLLAVFAGSAAVYYLIQRHVVYPSFLALEREEARKDAARAIEALQRELELLEPSASDWARWDDTYRFIEDRNPEYAGANLNADAVISLKVNYLGLYDLQGRRRWGLGLDPDRARPLDDDAFLPAQLPPAHPLRSAANATAPVAGILSTAGGPALFVSHPILDSTGAGPARGNVILARRLDAAAIARVGAQTHVALRILGLDGAADTVSAVATGHLPHTQVQWTQLADRWSGTTTLLDLNGHPALRLAIATPRDITRRGSDALELAGGCALVAAGVLFAIILLSLQRTLLDPLAQLTRHAARVGDHDDLSARLTSTRADEIGALAREFDRMVEHLADARRRLLEQSYRAGVAEMASGVLHNIGNAVTPVGVKLSRLRQTLAQAPVDDLVRAAAELANPGTAADRREDLQAFAALAGIDLAALTRRIGADLAHIEHQFDHVQAILIDQQRFSHAEQITEAVALAPLLAQTLPLLPDALRDRIRIELAADLPTIPAVAAVRVALQQVLGNLLLNAAEAVVERHPGADGEIAIAAVVETCDGAAMVHLRIADNGVGIDPQHLPHLFQSGFSTKQRGSGSGLHWTANTVHALGGRLYAESAGVGLGACFHLLLPRATAPRLESAA